MTFDKFTIKAQEAIQSAVNTAQRNGQQTIDPVHILAGVMDKGKDVVNYVFQKLGMNSQMVETAVQNEINHLPKVSGGEPYFSPEANKVMQRTLDISQKLGDEFVSIEPLLLALLNVNSTASRLQRCWMYRKGLEAQRSTICDRDRKYSRKVVMRTIRHLKVCPESRGRCPCR